MLFEIALDRTLDVGKTEDEPVDEQDGQAGVILRKSTAPRAVHAEEAIEPIEMREISGEDAEHFQFEPAHFQDDGHQADSQKDSSAQAVNAVLAQAHGEVAKEEREAGDELRAITQRLERHTYRNKQHERAVHSEPGEVGREDSHRADVVDAVGAEEKQRPASSNSATADKPVAILLLEENSTDKESRRGEIGKERLASRAKRAQFLNSEVGHPHHEQRDANFQEPVRAEGFLDRGNSFHALLEGGLRRRIFGQAYLERVNRQWRGDSRGKSARHFPFPTWRGWRRGRCRWPG